MSGQVAGGHHKVSPNDPFDHTLPGTDLFDYIICPKIYTPPRDASFQMEHGDLLELQLISRLQRSENTCFGGWTL